MKVAVINFSGNVGKSTIAKHLLLPRMKNAAFISVESINADEGNTKTISGKQFGQLQEQLLVLNDAVIDVGASNVEEFIKLMQQYRGSHEEFDLYIVPTVKDGKQIRDTISTLEALSVIGIPSIKTHVIFNRIEPDEEVENIFYPLFAYHEDSRAFTLRAEATIRYSELYQRIHAHQTDIPTLMQYEQPYYKTKLKEALAAKSVSMVNEAKALVSMRRLAEDAQENLNQVYSIITQ